MVSWAVAVVGVAMGIGFVAGACATVLFPGRGAPAAPVPEVDPGKLEQRLRAAETPMETVPAAKVASPDEAWLAELRRVLLG